MATIGPVALRGHEGIRLPDLISDTQTSSKIAQRGRAALQHLLEAHECAVELARNHWDFAVEIGSLRQDGLSDSVLRWLVCKDYVEHGREMTLVGDDGRHFRQGSGLTFHRRTCVILTTEGVNFARKMLADNPPVTLSLNGASKEVLNGVAHGASVELVPKWDSARQRLTFGTTIIKEFKVPAANQEMIISAFEEEGWPPRIDDPLPPQPEQDPKRRLHDTINSLNRNQKSFLLRFLGDGSGQGIRWEPVEVANGSPIVSSNGTSNGKH